jgi:hypothetical protein
VDNATETNGPKYPWEKDIIPAEIAACRLCDTHGLLDLLDQDDVALSARCSHDAVKVRANLTARGYRLRSEVKPRVGLPADAGSSPAPVEALDQVQGTQAAAETLVKSLMTPAPAEEGRPADEGELTPLQRALGQAPATT